MDDRNINMDFEELFRKKLESAEQDPGDTVRKSLMKKLERREFLRFNPARINIYYTALIAAAGITAAILITKESSGKKQESKTLQEVVVDSRSEGESTQTAITTENKNNDLTWQGISESDKSNAGSAKSKSTINQYQVRNLKDTSVIRINRDTLEKKVNAIESISDRKGTEALRKNVLAGFAASVNSGCMPLKVRFRNNSVAYDSCYWVFGDGGHSSLKEPEWIYDRAGEYKVTLKVWGHGNMSTVSSSITVYPLPEARFEMYPENPIIPDDEIKFMNYSVDGMRFRWDFGDGSVSEVPEPVHRYQKHSSYDVRLIALTEFGCTDTLTVSNAFAGTGSYITFPNAFIPNSDGPSGGNYSTRSDEAAQIFHPVTSGVSDYQLRIFSKTGILIFESNDINTGWDGYHKGQLCDHGVYIWKVRGTFKNGEQFVKMGDVTLLRR